MKALRGVVAGLVCAGLVGCTSTQIKQTMPEDRYEKYAELYSLIRQCSNTGKVPTNIASKAVEYINNGIVGFSFDNQKLQSKVESALSKNVSPSDSDCNQVEKYVQLRSQQVASNKVVGVDTSAFDSTSKTKTTYCNHIGFQTMCTSY